jgi:hypothetical protein
VIGGLFDVPVSSVFFSGGLAFVNRVIHCAALPAAVHFLLVYSVVGKAQWNAMRGM